MRGPRLASDHPTMGFGEPVLRDRPAGDGGMAPIVEPHSGVVAGASHMRFRTSRDHLRLSVREAHQDRARDLSRTPGRVPGHGALGDRFLPLSQYPCALLHHLSGRIGVPPVDAPMDFAGCMEVYLGGEWHIFDPRNNVRRIGRIIIARGRDAGDVAISTAFGTAWLQTFRVWTDEISDVAEHNINPPPYQQQHQAA